MKRLILLLISQPLVGQERCKMLSNVFPTSSLASGSTRIEIFSQIQQRLKWRLR